MAEQIQFAICSLSTATHVSSMQIQKANSQHLKKKKTTSLAKSPWDIIRQTRQSAASDTIHFNQTYIPTHLHRKRIPCANKHMISYNICKRRHFPYIILLKFRALAVNTSVEVLM